MNDTTFILEQIQRHLAEPNAAPLDIINHLVPKTTAVAKTWARRLPLLPEFREQFGPQAVGIARTIAKRGMREHGQRLTEDGRIIADRDVGHRWPDPKPTRVFMLPVGDTEVKVEYTTRYFPHNALDTFYFLNTRYTRPPPGEYTMPDGSLAHLLSGTGFLNQFVDHDVVQACGGPEAYAAMFAGARL